MGDYRKAEYEAIKKRKKAEKITFKEYGNND